MATSTRGWVVQARFPGVLEPVSSHLSSACHPPPLQLCGVEPVFSFRFFELLSGESSEMNGRAIKIALAVPREVLKPPLQLPADPTGLQEPISPGGRDVTALPPISFSCSSPGWDPAPPLATAGGKEGRVLICWCTQACKAAAGAKSPQLHARLPRGVRGPRAGVLAAA